MLEPATIALFEASFAAQSLPPTVAKAVPLDVRMVLAVPVVGRTMEPLLGSVKFTVPPTLRAESRPRLTVTVPGLPASWTAVTDDAPALMVKPLLALFLKRWLLVAPAFPLISSAPPPRINYEEPVAPVTVSPLLMMSSVGAPAWLKSSRRVPWLMVVPA